MWRCCSFHRNIAGTSVRGPSFSTARTCACSACPTTRQPRPSPCSKTHRSRSSTRARRAGSTPNGSMGYPRFHPRTKNKFAVPQKVANCGCYPVGFILAVRPLISQGLLLPTAPLTINAASGYSGGGKTMIAEYEGEDEPQVFLSVRPRRRAQALARDLEIQRVRKAAALCAVRQSFVLRHDRQHAGAHGTFRPSPASIAQPCTRSGARTTRTAPL